jgi:adenosylcobinamide-phosphate synthase
MGKAIEAYEKGARWSLSRWGRVSPGAERAAGVALALGLPLTTYATVRQFLRRLPRPLRPLAELWLVSTAIAGRDLGEHAHRVERALADSLVDGRRQVSYIVGRDTEALDEGQVVRATVETVAENTSDGLVAPLAYAFAGGAPLALGYKAVSTLDSMVGYRNDRYLHFGWASARLDDAANLLPARLTALLATLAAGRGPATVRRWWQDRRLHASPNAGLVEAAFAQALRLQLGGGAIYGGRYVEREPLGAEFPSPGRGDIARAVSLSENVGLMALGAGVACLMLGAGLARGDDPKSERRGRP